MDRRWTARCRGEAGTETNHSPSQNEKTRDLTTCRSGRYGYSRPGSRRCSDLNRTRERRYRGPRRLLVLGTVLAGMLLSGPPAAVALDPDLRISQYAHAAWRVRDRRLRGCTRCDNPNNRRSQRQNGQLWSRMVAGCGQPPITDGVQPFISPADRGDQAKTPGYVKIFRCPRSEPYVLKCFE